MKLDINEIYFLKQASESVNIKVTDAKFATVLMEKLDKEFERLQKAEEKKVADVTA